MTSDRRRISPALCLPNKDLVFFLKNQSWIGAQNITVPAAGQILVPAVERHLRHRVSSPSACLNFTTFSSISSKRADGLLTEALQLCLFCVFFVGTRPCRRPPLNTLFRTFYILACPQNSYERQTGDGLVVVPLSRSSRILLTC